MELLRDREILLGCYEEFVLGFSVDENSRGLVANFSNHAHAGSVKALAAGGKYLVSGGSDENVKIFNLRKRDEHGTLQHHDGTISCAVFHENGKFLFTGSEDHKICILKANTWSVEKTLLKHQGTVTDISVHPSGKLALSVGQDQKLITWNLIKGRSAYVTNVKEAADFVRWSPSGKFYAVGFYQHVDVYDVGTASVIYAAPVKGRANAVVFLDEDTIIAAGDGPNVGVHSISRQRLLHEFAAHERRVRCLHLEPGQYDDDKEFALVTASNDGLIKIWRGSHPSPDHFKFDMDVSHDAKCRITCLVVHKTPEIKEPTKLMASPPANGEVITVQDDEGEDVGSAKKGNKKRKKPSTKKGLKPKQSTVVEIEAAAENLEDKVMAKRVRLSEKAKKVLEPRTLRQRQPKKM